MYDRRPPWQRDEESYMGLDAAQFNALILLVLGGIAAAAAIWLFLFDGLEAVGLSGKGGAPERGTLVDVGQGQLPPFEWGDCKFDIPVGARVDCGYMTVPENRSDPNSKTIRLHVGVFRTDNAQKAPDPILYLGGGPGENSTEASSYFYDDLFKPFLKNRDFIVLDQRGAGFSEPDLDCQELDETYRDLLSEDLSLEDERARGAEALVKCHDRLAGEGVNLASYRSAESAADVNDLRRALGYEQWNLYGVSYGTRLALTVMRDFPQGVRSVILDSSYPLQANLYTSIQPNARRAFDTFFNGCAGDPACNSSYPALRSVFFQTVDELNASPVTETIVNPLFRLEYESVVVDGDMLVSFLFGALYSTDAIPVRPAIIYQVANGDTYAMGAIMGGFFAEFEELFTPGMHVAVQCSDEAVFGNADEVAASIAAYPELRGLTEGDPTTGTGLFSTCAGWGPAPADPKENAPVTSDIPTLVLAGEYDPITPPGWGQAVSDTLNNDRFYIFPGTGHGVATSGECPLNMTLAFMDNPGAELDASCIGGMGGPDWLAP